MAPPRYVAARVYAFEAHEGQMYGDKPYTSHIVAVVAVAREFRIDAYGAEYIPACYLHDVVEDTETEIDDISKEFGARVADLVAAVTCVKGLSRKEKFEEAYPRIRRTKGAILLKLCDRIANVRNCILTKSVLLSMYAKEHPVFRAQLFDSNDLAAAPLWIELDKLLAFKA